MTWSDRLAKHAQTLDDAGNHTSSGTLTNYAWQPAATRGPVAPGTVSLQNPPTAGPNVLTVASKDAAGVAQDGRLQVIAANDVLVLEEVAPAGQEGPRSRVQVTGAGTPGATAWTFPVLWPSTSQPAPSADVALHLGVAGPMGPAGPQGLASTVPGPQGPAGATGSQGPAGAAGTQGPKGDPGTAGTAGAQGPAGPTGPASTVPGPQGPAGTAGAQGPKGDTGLTGPAGPSTGPAGGDLSGTYPNPSVVDDSHGHTATTAMGGGIAIRDEGALIGSNATDINFVGSNVSVSGTGGPKVVTIVGTPSGAAGGDLTGSYPNPTILKGIINATAGGSFKLLASTGGARDVVELGANGLKFGGDTELLSPSAGLLQNRGPSGSNATYGILAEVGRSAVMSGNVVGDSTSRFALTGSATFTGLELGAGTGARDVNLYRAGIDLLKTDDALWAVLGVRTFVKAGAPVDADFPTGFVGDGIIAINSSTLQIYVRIGGVWRKTAAMT